MENFFNLSYWFSARPSALSPYIIELFFIFVVALIALTIFFAILKTRTRKSIFYKTIQSFYILFLTNAIIGAFLLFFSYEQIPFLSSRFWIILWAVGNCVWLVFIIRKLLSIPKIKTAKEKEKEFKKYIP